MYIKFREKSTVAVCLKEKSHIFFMFSPMHKFVYLHILQNCSLENAAKSASQFPKVWPKLGGTTARSRLYLFKLGF